MKKKKKERVDEDGMNKLEEGEEVEWKIGSDGVQEGSVGGRNMKRRIEEDIMRRRWNEEVGKGEERMNEG